MGYINFLKTQDRFRTLWYIDILMSFGSWFTTVAIYTILVRYEASAFFIAVVAAFHWLPGALQAPLTGIVLDRVDPKKLMGVLLSIELVTTLSYLLIDSKEILWLLVILVFFRMSSASFMFTAMQTVVPKLVGKESLRMANDIISVTWSLTFVVGMALGGLAAHFIGTSFAFIFDASLFVVALIILKGADLPKKVDLASEKLMSLLKGGLKYLNENRNIVKIILLHATVGFTSFDALVTLLAKNQYFDTLSEPLTIGIINSVRAMGLFLGPFIFIKFKENMRLLFWLLILQGSAIILWGFLQYDFYISLIGIFLTGVFTTSIWSITYSFIQRETQEEFRGRVVAYNDMIFLLSNALISILIGILASLAVPLSYITMTLGALFLLCAIFI